jgi:methylmalonyl-CoA carboxyltransferase 12S subunit
MSEVSRAEFDALKAEIAGLRAEISKLTSSVAMASAPKKEEGISDEHLQILSAAVAAFMGKRATIKYIRRGVGNHESWRTQGRVTVAASHQLPRTKGW